VRYASLRLSNRSCRRCSGWRGWHYLRSADLERRWKVTAGCAPACQGKGIKVAPTDRECAYACSANRFEVSWKIAGIRMFEPCYAKKCLPSKFRRALRFYVTSPQRVVVQVAEAGYHASKRGRSGGWRPVPSGGYGEPAESAHEVTFRLVSWRYGGRG